MTDSLRQMQPLTKVDSSPGAFLVHGGGESAADTGL